MTLQEWVDSPTHQAWLRAQKSDQHFKDFISVLESESCGKKSTQSPSNADAGKAFGMVVGYQYCLDNIEMMSADKIESVKIKEKYGKAEQI